MILLFLLSIANADELGFRYNNLGTNTLEFSGGKITEITYNHALHRNVFLEFAAGPYFYNDFDHATSFIGECSPGLQVRSGDVRVRLSQGVAYVPYSELPALEYATHISISLIDPKTNVSIGLERSHYSNGKSEASNTGLDMTGLIIGVFL